MLYFIPMNKDLAPILDFHGHPIANGPKVVTIGNFDGMHLGHQKLVSEVVRLARQEKIPGGMLTFEPHPLKILVPEKGLKNIFEPTDRIEVGRKLGLDFVVIEPFSRTLSELMPEDFFNKILLTKLQAQFLFVGHDFSFGKNRSGSIEVLQRLCGQNKVTLHVIPAVELRGETISSTKIRAAMVDGNPALAAAYLGRPFYLKGVVEKGAGRGKKIGFPTANLFTQGELLPKIGIYATTFEVKGKIFQSVTNVGKNPTFQEKTRHPIQVETYVMDFDQDIYGEACKINFLKYLRSELKFESVEKLIAAIGQDVKNAEEFFRKNK